MRVLFYIKNLKAGGAERAVIEVINNWKSDNDEIKILLGSEHGDLKHCIGKDTILSINKRSKNIFLKILNKIGISRITHKWGIHGNCKKLIKNKIGLHKPASFFENNLLDKVERIHSAVKRFKPDVIISSLVETGHLPIWLYLEGCIKRKTPLWIAIEQNNTLQRINDYYSDNVERDLWLNITKMVYNRCNHVVAVSQGVKCGLVSNIEVPEKKISVINNPAFSNSQETSDKLTKEEKYILAVGRLHSQKQHDHLIIAFSRVCDQIPDIKLLIAGSGKLLNQYKELCNKLGIFSRVEFLGVRTDIKNLLYTAQGFILTSKYEGFPLSLVEAMEAGCPVISYDCDYGPSEIIIDGVNGRLIEKNNIDALQMAIMDLLQNRNCTERMRQQAKMDVMKYSSLDISGQYQKLIYNIYEMS